MNKRTTRTKMTKIRNHLYSIGLVFFLTMCRGFQYQYHFSPKHRVEHIVQKGKHVLYIDGHTKNIVYKQIKEDIHRTHILSQITTKYSTCSIDLIDDEVNQRIFILRTFFHNDYKLEIISMNSTTFIETHLPVRPCLVFPTHVRQSYFMRTNGNICVAVWCIDGTKIMYPVETGAAPTIEKLPFNVLHVSVSVSDIAVLDNFSRVHIFSHTHASAPRVYTIPGIVGVRSFHFHPTEHVGTFGLCDGHLKIFRIDEREIECLSEDKFHQDIVYVHTISSYRWVVCFENGKVILGTLQKNVNLGKIFSPAHFYRAVVSSRVMIFDSHVHGGLCVYDMSAFPEEGNEILRRALTKRTGSNNTKRNNDKNI